MISEAIESGERWYAICTHPRQEERANRNLTAWGIVTFTPKMRVLKRSPFTGRPEYMTQHMFGRYIFAQFDLYSNLHRVRFTRGVHSIVSCGTDPIPVQEDIIQSLKDRIGSEGYVRIGEDFKQGTKVRITDGVLKDFIGVFERTLQDEDRVRILLTAINYQVHVDVERALVSKISQPI